jgi:hypothetical protein
VSEEIAARRRESQSPSPATPSRPQSIPEWIEWLLDKHQVEDDDRERQRLGLARVLLEVPEAPDTPIRELQELAVVLDEEDYRLAQRYAVTAAVGGTSQLKSAKQRRDLADLVLDQLVSHLGSIAFFNVAFGKTEGRRAFTEMRDKQDLNPTKGDNGQDIQGQPVDFKTSLRRKTDGLLGDYQLPVRERERHAGNVYVLNIVEPLSWDRPGEQRPSRLVRLVGFALDEEMTYQEQDPDHVFGPKNGKPGAFRKNARDLHSLPRDLRAIVREGDGRVDVALHDFASGKLVKSPKRQLAEAIGRATRQLDDLVNDLTFPCSSEEEKRAFVESVKRDLYPMQASVSQLRAIAKDDDRELVPELLNELERTISALAAAPSYDAMLSLSLPELAPRAARLVA